MIDKLSIVIIELVNSDHPGADNDSEYDRLCKK